MSLTDRIARGLEAGWKVTDATTLTDHQTHEPMCHRRDWRRRWHHR